MKTQDEHYIELARGVLMVTRPSAVPVVDLCKTIKSKINVLRAIGTLYPRTHLSGSGLRPIVSGYPSISADVAAKIILGIPVGIGLTSAERHQWLLDGASSEPHVWLLRGTVLQSRSVAVSRWLITMNSDTETRAALFARRRWGSLAEHSIDLIDSDCGGGVLEAIRLRELRHLTTEHGDGALCGIPRWFRSLGGRVRLLRTARDLEAQGNAQKNCVSGYANSVKRGTSFIAAISAWGQSATVEYDREGNVVQISSKCNAPSGALCRRLAELAVRRDY